MQTLTVDFHRSVRAQALQREAIESLQANRIAPKFLYVTPLQADLWRQVSRKHSPVHSNPEFTRIYREAFARVVDRLEAKKVFLAGLGCGTGRKEAAFQANLKAGGREVLFSAIDVSHDLVLESAERLVEASAGHERSLVCDLAQAEFLGEWLQETGSSLSRLITFFGLLPNFVPSMIARLFRSILRPGDLLLASAHLVPIQHENREATLAAMRGLLPQYDNPETLAWLTAALRHWKLEHLVEPPEMVVGQVEGIPAFLGLSRWKSEEPFERWGRHFSPSREDPLRLFYSLRYTPSLLEDRLRQEGFQVEMLAITSCRQEGIWCIRNG